MRGVSLGNCAYDRWANMFVQFRSRSKRVTPSAPVSSPRTVWPCSRALRGTLRRGSSPFSKTRSRLPGASRSSARRVRTKVIGQMSRVMSSVCSATTVVSGRRGLIFSDAVSVVGPKIVHCEAGWPEPIWSSSSQRKDPGMSEDAATPEALEIKVLELLAQIVLAHVSKNNMMQTRCRP